MARVILAKFDPLTRAYTFVGTDSSKNEKLYIESTLDAGEYHVFSKVSWPYEEKCSVVISLYAPVRLELQGLKANEILDNYLGETLEDFADKFGTVIELAEKLLEHDTHLNGKVCQKTFSNSHLAVGDICATHNEIEPHMRCHVIVQTTQ